MFSTDFIFRQQENLVDNQKCWAGFRPLCNKILLFNGVFFISIITHKNDECVTTIEIDIATLTANTMGLNHF